MEVMCIAINTEQYGDNFKGNEERTLFYIIISIKLKFKLNKTYKLLGYADNLEWNRKIHTV